MDRRIRQVAGLLTVLLVGVALSSGYVQGLRSEEVANRTGSNPAEPAVNPFRIFRECRWERGAILSIDGQVLAESRPGPPGRRCRFQRVYPLGELVSHVVGYWSLHFGKTGLEAAYNADLVGRPRPPGTLAEFFTERERVGHTLVSTIDTRLQRVALEALGGRRGGVVALNPRTGAVLVAASVPSYDPNPVASNDREVAERALCALGGLDRPGCHNPSAPLLSVALQSRRPPGSSFKVVTAAAALESGRYSPSTRIPATSAYTPPGDNRAIHNFGGGSCGGTLLRSLAVSCNTAFAQVAVAVGADQLLTVARAMGLEQAGGRSFVGCAAPPLADILETRTGCLPSEFDVLDAAGRVRDRERLARPGYRARAGFGQWRLQVSPFGMAVVAATVANGGYVPRPRFAERVLDRGGAVVREIRTGVGAQALSRDTAEALTTMMRAVVTSGTAARAFAGFRVPVAGKTGTAQQPSCPPDEQAVFGPRCGRLPHAWFVAFAPADDPTIAVAVLVERGGGDNEEATGGRLAAPVARRLLEAYFQLYPPPTGGGQG